MNIIYKPFYFYVLLGTFWLCLHIYLAQQLGVKIMFDSHRYINFTYYILNNGIDFSSHDSRYIGYSLFLALFFKLNFSYTAIISIQILISGTALLALYFSTLRLTNSELTALVAATIFVIHIELSAWNFYILTESLFISLSLISFYLLLSAGKNWQYLVNILLLAFIFILRPNGFIFSLAAAIYLLNQLWHKHPNWKTHFILSICVCISFIVFILNNYLLKTYKILDLYKRGDIIFGYWDLLIKPSSPEAPPTTFPLLNIILFFLHNIAYFMQAGTLKVLFFFIHIKPYYSLIHNLFIATTLFPTYYFAIRAKIHEKSVLPFIYTVTGLQTIMVFLTSEDWDGRFIFPILPFIFILSASGLISHLKNNASRR